MENIAWLLIVTSGPLSFILEVAANVEMAPSQQNFTWIYI